MSRKQKDRSNNTVGLCSICEEYVKQGHYRFMKTGAKDPAIVCFECEKTIDERSEHDV